MRAKIWELAKKFGRADSDSDSSARGRSGVGGTRAIAGGCGVGATGSSAEDAPDGIWTWTLENVKGRVVIGGSSWTEGVSEA